MKINKTESNRTFVPKKIGETLSKVNKSILANLGRMNFLLCPNGHKSKGNFFADHSEPDRISRVTEELNELDEPVFKNFLHVKVSPLLLNFNTTKIQLLRKLIVFG